jgi:N-acetylglucosamine-6-phosphate deacetylase
VPAAAVPPAHRLIRFTDCQLARDGTLVREDLWVLDGTVVDPMQRWWDSSSSSEFLKPTVVSCKGQILAPGFYDLQINGGFGVDFACPQDVTSENLSKVAQGLLSHGVVAFLPTLVSSSAESYRALIPRHNALRRQQQQQLDQMAMQRLHDPGKAVAHMGNGGGDGNGTGGGKSSSASSSAQELDRGGLGLGGGGGGGGGYISGRQQRHEARILGLHLEGPFMNPAKKGAHDAANLREPVNGLASLLEVRTMIGGGSKAVTYH